MRIAVFGAGGVGGYIGAKLSKSTHDVMLVARGAHLDAIRKNGLRIVEDEKRWSVHPQACTEEELEGIYDLALLCVKSYDLKNAVEKLAPHVNPQSIVIAFANGVDHARTIQDALDAKVLHGCVYILSHLEMPGVIRKEGSVFAALFGAPEHPAETAAVAALFETAGLRCKTPEAIETALWKKYIFISGFAMLTSYYDISIKTVAETHSDETRLLLDEIAAVARAKGIDLESEAIRAYESALKLPPSASTSMQRDFQHGRATELETLGGYVAHEGVRLGIETPIMEKLYKGLRNG